MPDVTAGQKTEDTFTQLYVSHQATVARTVSRGLRDGDRHLVEDLAQETFLRLWRYLDSGHTVEHPAALLATMARRVLADHYRRRSSLERPCDFSDPAQARRLPVSASAEDIAIDRLIALVVADVLELPVRSADRMGVAA